MSARARKFLGSAYFVEEHAGLLDKSYETGCMQEGKSFKEAKDTESEIEVT